MSEAAFTSLCTLTVFFEDPFWVGAFERLDERGCSAARVVFGGESSNPEVYTYLLNAIACWSSARRCRVMSAP